LILIIQFLGTTPLYKRLKKTAVPSIFPWVEKSEKSLQRAERAKSRGIKRKLEDDFSSTSSTDEVIYATDELQVAEEIVCSFTQSPDEDIQIPVQEPASQFYDVHTQTPRYPPMSIDNFINDDAGVNFYTGYNLISNEH
jgi:hypothetical protein